MAPTRVYLEECNKKMDFKLDIKTLIMLLTIAATLGGFYYTTQSRINSLEEEVTTINNKIKRLNRQLKIIK